MINQEKCMLFEKLKTNKKSFIYKKNKHSYQKEKIF